MRNLGWTWRLRVKSGSDQAERRCIMPFMGAKTSRGERSPEGGRCRVHHGHHITPLRTPLTDGLSMLTAEVGLTHASDAHTSDTYQTDYLDQIEQLNAPREQDKVLASQL